MKSSEEWRRILLVEDEEGLVLALEDGLGTEGYEVHAAGDGKPILMLTARGTSIDTVMGLRLGADDHPHG